MICAFLSWGLFVLVLYIQFGRQPDFASSFTSAGLPHRSSPNVNSRNAFRAIAIWSKWGCAHVLFLFPFSTDGVLMGVHLNAAKWLSAANAGNANAARKRIFFVYSWCASTLSVNRQPASQERKMEGTAASHNNKNYMTTLPTYIC